MRYLKSLYAQVLIGVALGVLVGALWPHLGASLKPLGDAFVKLIKMLIAPVVFCTVAVGVARVTDARRVGRIGLRALLYFEGLSTLALLAGLAVAAVVRPGAGFNVDPARLDAHAVAAYASQAQKSASVTDYLLHLIPDTYVSAFAAGDILQVLLLALLTGFAMAAVERAGVPVTEAVERAGKVVFALVRIVVRAAPIGAFGAMAYTVGAFGLGSLVKLGALVACVYGASILFVVIALGVVARLAGFSIFRFLLYIREELLIVLGASSSEAVLPQLMTKLERLGASREVVGLVTPAGYSFNLDGTNIYMTTAILFLAQATNTPLSLGQLAVVLLVAMLTSKGASGVTGAGFVVLALTLGAVGTIPVAAIALILGVDRFMSESRALTNVIGNAVGTLVIAKWEGALDLATLRRELGGRRGLDSTVSQPPLAGEASRAERDA